jgi:phosphonopyruvate decarboxylase
LPLDPRLLFDGLRAAGVREFTGVPCSILDPIVMAAERDGAVSYVPASVEGEGIAIAAGAWLAGSMGAVLLQNSGLGNTINPLSSLAIPYGIPMILIVSWRGEPGKEDAVHHSAMGSATLGLFELFGIPFEVLTEGSDLGVVARRAHRTAVDRRRPFAIVVPRGLFAKSPCPVVNMTRRVSVETPQAPHFAGEVRPSRSEVMRRVVERSGDATVISTTGYASRELAAYDNARHFPMQGSMGFALGIGLGITRAAPKERVLVLDGDGAAIMRLGSFSTAGFLSPIGLVHFVLDNATYASTGGQATVSPNVDFATVALACGYRAAASCLGVEFLDAALDFALARDQEGPLLLRVLISAEEPPTLDRPSASPPDIALRFRDALGSLGGESSGLRM